MSTPVLRIRSKRMQAPVFAMSRRLLGTEAVCVLFYVAGVRKLVEGRRDVLGIEIQASSEVTSGALRVPGKKPDDARGRVALAAARGGAPGARASRGGTTNRASRSGRGTILAAKLLDLLLQPSHVLPDVSSISAHTGGSRTRKYRVCDCCLVDGVARIANALSQNTDIRSHT